MTFLQKIIKNNSSINWITEYDKIVLNNNTRKLLMKEGKKLHLLC